MKVEQAIKLFKEYQRVNLKKNTINSYRITLSKFNDETYESVNNSEVSRHGE